MHRVTITSSAMALLATVALLACDKPGATEQQKENSASQQAAQQVDEANRNAQSAQAEAQRKIASARADFEKDRDDYRHRRDQDLIDINKKVSELEAKQRTATGKDRAKLDQSLPALRAQRDTFSNDLQHLDNVTPASWDGARDSLDKEYNALSDALSKAQ
jgi:type II secretory pathway pseudopilin PulG